MSILRGQAACAGAAFLAVGLIIASDTIGKSAWRQAEATVIGVNCALTATGGGQQRLVPCSEIKAFEAAHDGEDWIVSDTATATLHIVGDAGVVRAPMTLNRNNDPLPQAGDILPVLQNPARPQQFTPVASRRDNALVAVLLGAIGAVLLFLALRGSRALMIDDAVRAHLRDLPAASEQPRASASG